MHSIQADSTFGSPHVEAHSKTMRDVVVHPLFHTTTKLCSTKKKPGKTRTEIQASETEIHEINGPITLSVSKSVFKQHELI